MLVKPKPKPALKAKASLAANGPAIPWRVAFDSRTDLKPYAEDALGLFALGSGPIKGIPKAIVV